MIMGLVIAFSEENLSVEWLVARVHASIDDLPELGGRLVVQQRRTALPRILHDFQKVFFAALILLPRLESRDQAAQTI
jgi:hypothetical protein